MLNNLFTPECKNDNKTPGPFATPNFIYEDINFKSPICKNSDIQSIFGEDLSNTFKNKQNKHLNKFDNFSKDHNVNKKLLKKNINEKQILKKIYNTNNKHNRSENFSKKFSEDKSTDIDYCHQCVTNCSIIKIDMPDVYLKSESNCIDNYTNIEIDSLENPYDLTKIIL